MSSEVNLGGRVVMAVRAGIEIGVAGATLAAFFAVSGCAVSSSQDDVQVSRDGILVCGQVDVPGADGSVQQKTEWYSVTAMNNKLRHYPEFAATTDIAHVEKCSEAREFYDAYVAYAKQHPKFDADEPLENLVLPEPELSEEAVRDAADRALVPKILNGSPNRLSPVVRLINDRGQSCTGTFIAKNWIVTAAHCVDVDPKWVRYQGCASTKQAAGCTDPAVIHTWYSYTVVFPTSGGQQDPTLHPPLSSPGIQFTSVLQHVDPAYIGDKPTLSATEVTLSGGPHDVALLFVNEAFNDLLPDVDKSLNKITDPAITDPDISDPAKKLTTGDFPFMRISLKDSFVDPYVWGWGFRTETPAPNAPFLLTYGHLTAYSLLAVPNGYATYQAPPPAFTGSVPYLCKGDSGGPLAERLNIVTSPDPTPQPQWVIGGTFSGFETQPGVADANCGTLDKADWDVWARLAPIKDWIKNTVASYPKKFRCIEKMSSGSSTADYMECWGPPCTRATEATDCGSGAHCYKPGTEYTSQSGCMYRCPKHDCSCLHGMCVPD
ncbi:MAG TPA: trypsin-like serine protease [Polyangiaceae bacterium]|nr:trypsin-like serine protease [Polyangiaceae bacterium]